MKKFIALTVMSLNLLIQIYTNTKLVSAENTPLPVSEETCGVCESSKGVTKEKLIDVFKNTCKKLAELYDKNRDNYMNSSVTYASFKNKVDKLAVLPHHKKTAKNNITVEKSRPLAMVNKFISDNKINKKDKTAVLNIANYYSPGGLVAIGGNGREECLSRISDLYAHLVHLNSKFYCPNLKLYDSTGEFCDERGFYTKGVKQLKKDIPLPTDNILSEDKQTTFDCISVSAPNLSESVLKENNMNLSENDKKEILTARIELIIAIAIENKVDNLVLGAFGCGKRGIEPKLSAEIFYDILVKRGYSSFFKNIMFPIIVNKENKLSNEIFEAFSKKFTNCSPSTANN